MPEEGALPQEIQDGLDEISVSAPTSVCEYRNGTFQSYIIEPEKLGIPHYRKEEITGGTPEENAAITREILNGGQGAKTDAVVINAAAGIYVATPDITLKEAVDRAREVLMSGMALERLNRFVNLSNQA